MKIFNTTESGYRFDKRIFFLPIFILVIVYIYLLYSNGVWQHAYLKCQNPNGCENPFATQTPVCQGMWCPPILCDESWCTEEWVPLGEYGKKPNFIQNYFGWFAWILLAIAFIANHLIHNKGVKFSLPKKHYLLPNWMAKIIQKFFPKFTNEIDISKLKNLKD